MQTADKPSQDVIRQAADWAALLDDAQVDAQTREACNAWCAQHPSHRLAYDRMRAIGGRFSALDGAQRRTLSAASSAGRRVTGLVASVIACVAMAGTGFWFAKTNIDVQSLWPDHTTRVGEQTTLALSDGSSVVVDANTRLNVFADKSDRRELTLFEGRILAGVAKDASRAFTVRTREGSATALGTEYTVDARDGRTIVTVLESKVRVCPLRGDCTVLSAGQRAQMTGTGLEPTEAIDVATEGLWAKGWIEVHDRALTDVLDELSRYSAQPPRYDATRLEGVRITGSFPLTRPEAALQAIAETAPIRLTRTADGGTEISPR